MSAIDTEDKRRSVGGVIGPKPDGTVDDEYDRRHVSGLYRDPEGTESTGRPPGNIMRLGVGN